MILVHVFFLNFPVYMYSVRKDSEFMNFQYIYSLIDKFDKTVRFS